MAETPLTTYLFDLDGTLIDSVELIRRTFRHTLETHRGSVPSEAEWLQGLGQPLWDQFRVYTQDQTEIDAMIATYRAYNGVHHDALVRGYPGVHQVLASLKERGKRLGVVTSKMRRGTLHGLAHCGLDGRFDAIVAADDVDRHKPDPTPVLRALEHLGADARQTVFVGDSPHDLAAGRAAGVRTAAALWGPFPRAWLTPHQPDHWLSAPADVLSLE
ncbi:MAG TPA: HAD-IA family hydrolase [Gemmatimonadales bacterium]|nr:HAD-IA family hydrolase [Gemmatimonadales bacterium]